jgi:hypothetical protein
VELENFSKELEIININQEEIKNNNKNLKYDLQKSLLENEHLSKVI